MDEACGFILYSPEEGVVKSCAAGMILDLFSPFAKETHNIKDLFGQFGKMQEHCLCSNLKMRMARRSKFLGLFSRVELHLALLLSKGNLEKKKPDLTYVVS